MLLLPIGLLASGAAPVPLLLDGITATVAGAWALHKLRTAWSSACIRVRRSSDNAELDVGFSGGGLDTAALLTFCGAGSGYVAKVYDQSGNGRDLAQATASRQPRIINAGAMDVFGNGTARPAILLTASNTCFLTRASFPMGVSAFAGFLAASRTTGGNGGRLLSFDFGSNDYDNTQSAILAYNNSGALQGYRASGPMSARSTTTSPFVASSVFDGSNHTMTLDGAAGSSVSTSGALGTTGTLNWGTSPANECWDGMAGALIVTTGTVSSTDQTALRDGLKSYYGTP